MHKGLLFPLLAVGLGTCAQGLGQKGRIPKGDIHVEGEAAVESSLLPNAWLAPGKLPEPRLLSGGDWLTGRDPGKGGWAEAPRARWEFEVREAGRYQVWVRKFWRHGPFDWRIGEGAFRRCGRDRPLVGTRTLKPFVSLCWVPMGWVQLAKGRQSLELRFPREKGRSFVCGIDAFALRRRAFVPRGDGRGRKMGVPHRPGWFAWVPENRAPGPGSPINLRGRNEERAGAGGFVRREGDHFVDGRGRPLRFWGVNLLPDTWLLDGDTQALLARRLAAAGVNLARLHGDPMQGARLAGLRRLVDKLAAEGIYSTLSFYFHLWHRDAKGKTPVGRVFFDPGEQSRHWETLKKLLDAKPPGGGRRLAEEPALAWVELVNEDSLLFWTLDRIEGKARAQLERRYREWVSREAGGTRAGLAPAWKMAREGAGSRQARFLAGLQTAFYRDTMARARKELGLRSLLSASNWKTANPKTLGPLERASYQTGDLLDRHHYFGPKVQGRAASYAVARGQRYQDRSLLLEPKIIERAFRPIRGYPQAISELGWPSPNRFQLEAPMIIATSASLAGIDAPTLFAVSGPGFEEGLNKFPVQIPALFAQFPAASLAFRRGDLKDPKARRWDPKKGVLLYESAQSAGAVGQLGAAGRLALGPFKLRCRNSFAAVWTISLDDKTLATSKSVLIQVLPEPQYQGFRRQGDKIRSLGTGPWMLREVDLQLGLPGGRFHQALILDANGDLREKRDIPGKTLRLPKDSLYTVLR